MTCISSLAAGVQGNVLSTSEFVCGEDRGIAVCPMQALATFLLIDLLTWAIFAGSYLRYQHSSNSEQPHDPL